MQRSIIKQLLHPPQTHQSLRAHAVVILHYSLLRFMLAIVSISFFWILDSRSQMGLLVNGLILSGLLLSFFALQRGHVNLAGHIVIWSLWGILFFASFQNRGIYDPAYGALIIPLSLCAPDNCLVAGDGGHGRGVGAVHVCGSGGDDWQC